MWVCDICLEVNDDAHTKCVKCGEARPPQVKLADEIRATQAPAPAAYANAVANYIPRTPLIIPNSTTVSPALVRAGIITLALGWLILVGILAFTLTNPPVVSPSDAAGAASAAHIAFVRDRQILRIFLVIVLPLFVLFIPSTHWEFNPVSGLLIRSQGNLLSRREDGVWDMANIDKAHIGEIISTSAGNYSSDGDSLDLQLTIQLVFKNEDVLNIGPQLKDGKWIQTKVDEINRFLHRWQRQL